ncbi:hypothetical protein ACHAW5_002063 [Stephanodiscus triporus]|uniref:Uncharacterized protein n=1 Tax=Stephanodiscus triporus TaxID=2934178 RepID=A0ABD3NVB1_9STRA
MVRPSTLKLTNKHGHDPLYYPIKAVSYTISHPSLLKIVIRIACIGCALALFILVVLLATALKPQAKWISSNLRWWSWPIAVCLVLLESTICAGLLLLVSKSKAQKNLFVATMRQEGLWRENEMVSLSTLKDFKLLGKEDIVKFITIPLQTIPFVGGVVNSAINATFTGWECMGKYFKAIKLPSRLERVEVFGVENSGKFSLFHSSTYDINNDYARFGFMCGFLESIPIVGSVVFPLTNAVAAALFACDIERGGGPVCLRKEK